MKRGFIIVALLALSAPSTSFAGPDWYRGVVSRIAQATPSANEAPDFVVTFKNDVLSDCAHRYVYLTQAKLGAGGVKQALGLATASLMAKRSFGVVIDKAKKDAQGRCFATAVDLQ